MIGKEINQTVRKKFPLKYVLLGDWKYVDSICATVESNTYVGQSLACRKWKYTAVRNIMFVCDVEHCVAAIGQAY